MSKTAWSDLARRDTVDSDISCPEVIRVQGLKVVGAGHTLKLTGYGVVGVDQAVGIIEVATAVCCQTGSCSVIQLNDCISGIRTGQDTVSSVDNLPTSDTVGGIGNTSETLLISFNI